MCLTANYGLKLIVSVNRVRVVKHCLAVFDPIFLLDSSLESTFAQNKSCRSYRSLQLLFWQNFMFQCKIWSYGRSKLAKSHSNSVTVPPRLVSPPPILTSASPHVTPASTSPLKRPRCRVDRQVHFRFSVPLPFPARSTQLSRASRRSPPAFVPAKLAALLDCSHPKPFNLAFHLHRPSLSPISPFLGRNHTRNRQQPLTLTRAPPPLSSISIFRPSSIQSESTVSFPIPYSISPTWFPLGSSATIAGNTSRRRGCCVAAARSWPASL